MAECKLIIWQGDRHNELDTSSPGPIHALKRVTNIVEQVGIGPANPTVTQIDCIDAVTSKIIWTLKFGGNNEPISNS